jgi:hypothetical protein
VRLELPFTKQNRPWLTQEALDDMNGQYVACLKNIPPKDRENLRQWAADKVEMGWCHDKHTVLREHTVLKEDSPLREAPFQKIR